MSKSLNYRVSTVVLEYNFGWSKFHTQLFNSLQLKINTMTKKYLFAPQIYLENKTIQKSFSGSKLSTARNKVSSLTKEGRS